MALISQDEYQITIKGGIFVRKKIYQTVHVYEGNLLSTVYKFFMVFVIVLSLLPLTVKDKNALFFVIERVCLGVFIADYALRWVSADYKFGKCHWTSFARYPFRIISIIDLMSIFALVSSVFGLFRDGGMAEVLTVFRIVRIFRYSKGIRTIIEILKSSKKALFAVGSLAVGYIVISALIVFNVEPETFDSFFDAVYWATVSLTTVGYGDIYPVSVIGRAVSMLSSFFGIAIVALPAGVVTAEYMKSVTKSDEK